MPTTSSGTSRRPLDVQARPATPTDLPPRTRIDRGAPEHRGRSDGRQPLHQTQTGWNIKKFVRTVRRYRTVQIKAGRQILTAADPLPDDLRNAIAKIDNRRRH